MTNYHLDKFTRGYLEAALWTSDPDPGSGQWGEHDRWMIENIDDASIARAIEVCTDFQAANAADLAATGADDTRNGLDFWLTRNGHGAGFWDRGYGDVGERLTSAAHVYGEAYVIGPETGDNGACSEAQWDAWDGVIYVQD